jgi:RNA polymerase sigma factor (sigma-70 family)
MSKQPGQSALSALMNGLGRYPLLTAAQEIELGRAVQAAQAIQAENKATLTEEEKRIIERGAKAKQKMINCNLRIVLAIAKTKKPFCNFLELNDLFQFGCLGLIRAVEKFDPSRGYKFSTYAYRWIQQKINRGIDGAERVIAIPSEKRKTVTKVQQARNELGPDASLFAAIDAAGFTVKQYELAARSCQPVLSLNYGTGNEDSARASEMIDFVEAPSAASSPEEDEIALVVRNAVEGIKDDRHREIVKRRFGLAGRDPETLERIANDFGISREAVRLMQHRALAKLRLHLGQSLGTAALS